MTPFVPLGKRIAVAKIIGVELCVAFVFGKIPDQPKFTFFRQGAFYPQARKYENARGSGTHHSTTGPSARYRISYGDRCSEKHANQRSCCWLHPAEPEELQICVRFEQELQANGLHPARSEQFGRLALKQSAHVGNAIERATVLRV